MMQDGKTAAKLPHNLILEDRSHLTVSGVSDVDSFDENTVTVYTEMGERTIKGSDLHINALNVETGDLTVEGRVSSLVYTENSKTKGSLFSRIFK